MYNLPVKLSVMSAPYKALSPQVFLDREPLDCIRIFKAVLPERAANTVTFAFSDEALLLILEREFEVQVARLYLGFTKSALDSESWLLANGYAERPRCDQ